MDGRGPVAKVDDRHLEVGVGLGLGGGDQGVERLEQPAISGQPVAAFLAGHEVPHRRGGPVVRRHGYLGSSRSRVISAAAKPC